jgi:hypothetical protein
MPDIAPRSYGGEGVQTAIGVSGVAPWWGRSVNSFADYAGSIGNLYNALLFGNQWTPERAAAASDPRLPWNMQMPGGGAASAYYGGSTPPDTQAMGRGGMPAAGTGGYAGANSIYGGTGTGQGGVLGALLGAYQASTAGNLAGDVGLLSQYGPQAGAAINAVVPGQQQLQDLLNQQVTSDLQAGDQLSPMQSMRIREQIRSGQAARGQGYSPKDTASEAVALWLGGEELKQARQNNARTQMASNYALTTDPFMNLLGQSRQYGAMMSNQGLGQALGMMPEMNPYNAYASDLYNTNYNAAWADKWHNEDIRLAKSNANKALAGQIIGGVLGFAGNAAKPGCWVAREVYGEDNPKWVAFREWMLTKAPAAFRELYLEAGEAVAEYIRTKPELKNRIRSFMDAKLEAA